MRHFILALLFTVSAGIGAGCAKWTRDDVGSVLDKTGQGAAAGAAAGGPIGSVIGGALGLTVAVLGVLGGKAHSSRQVAAAQVGQAAAQAALQAVTDHRDQLAEHNDALAAKIDQAHDLVKLALGVAAPVPPPPPAAAAAADVAKVA